MEKEGGVGEEYGGAGVERGIGNRRNFKLGYVNIQGGLKKKLDLVGQLKGWNGLFREHNKGGGIVIDYILIGGALGENDILEMRVEDTGGVEIPTDHKLMWINIIGNGARSVCSEFRGNWNKVDKEKWAKFRGVLLALWNEKGVVEGLEGSEGCERVERVWEEYVQGFHSTRGLFRRGVASKRKSKGDKEFRGMVKIKRQELKRAKREWESAVGNKQVYGDKNVLDGYNKYVQVRGELNDLIEEEQRRKKSYIRQQVIGDGKGVEDWFWKYRRSKRKRGSTKVLKKRGGGWATSATDIRWELEKHWLWLDQVGNMEVLDSNDKRGEILENIRGGSEDRNDDQIKLRLENIGNKQQKLKWVRLGDKRTKKGGKLMKEGIC